MNSFQIKYNKYKIKYLELNKILNQTGKGLHPYDILIIGDRSDLHGTGFFEVGNHSTSKFGAGLNWRDPGFWDKFDDFIKDNEFKVIMIDDDSLNWCFTDCINNLSRVCTKHLIEQGIFIVSGPDPIFEQPAYEKLRSQLEIIGLKPIKKIGFNHNSNLSYYTIYAKNNGDILLEINQEDLNNYDISPGVSNSGYLDKNKDFKYVKESNQIEFVRNRFINKERPNYKIEDILFICDKIENEDINNILESKGIDKSILVTSQQITIDEINSKVMQNKKYNIIFVNLCNDIKDYLQQIKNLSNYINHDGIIYINNINEDIKEILISYFESKNFKIILF